MTTLISIGSFVCLLTAVVILKRHLPAQNVAFIILLLAGVEVGFELWEGTDRWIQGTLFWPGAIILMRAATQKILEPRRQAKNYGLVVLGTTSVASAALELGIGSLETAVARFCITTVCLLFLTPWLIQKRVTASAEARK